MKKLLWFTLYVLLFLLLLGLGGLTLITIIGGFIYLSWWTLLLIVVVPVEAFACVATGALIFKAIDKGLEA